MSRKSVPFTVPEGRRAPMRPGGRPKVIEAHSDEWVSDRNDGDPPVGRPDLLVDLAADRSLTEIFALSLLAPLALSWFWLMHAMAGRVRF